MELFLDLFTLFLKDMVYIYYKQDESLVFYDQRDWMARWCFSKPVTHWMTCIDWAMKTRHRLRQHVQPQLALERLMFQVKGG